MDPTQLYDFDGSNDYGTGSVSLASSRASWSLRVVTRSNSDGGTWSYAYAPSRTKGQYDITTITGPTGPEVYKYFGEGYFGETSTWSSLGNQSFFFYNYGANYSGYISPTLGTPNAPIIRNVWKLGVLAQESRGSQTIDYEWQAHLHSSIFFVVTSGVIGMRDEETYRPVLASKTHTRDGVVYATTFGSFDAHGNPTVIAESGPNGGTRTTTVSYLNDTTKWIIGRPKDEVVSSGASTYRSFDANGNLLSQTRAGVSTSHTYDVQGNVASTTFPRGLTHTYANYHRGVARNETQLEGVTLYRTVSDAGFILSQTDGEGHTTSFAYDGIGRPIQVTPPVGNASVVAYGTTTTTETRGSLVQTTQFDGFGRPTRVETGGVPVVWSYDTLGRKTFESIRGYTNIGDVFQYDALDRLTRVTHTADSSYRTLTYGAASGVPTIALRDERGHVTTKRLRSYGVPEKSYVMAIDTPVPAASLVLERNGEGQITRVTQDGIVRSYGYDSRFYLTSVLHPEIGTTTFGRDDAGNMTSRQVGGGGLTAYQYDGRNRLQQVSYPGNSPSTVTHSYWRTDKPRTMSNAVAVRSYGYDGNRNLMSESLVVDGLTMSAGYGYNANDQLSSITYPVLGRTATLSPDLLGRPTVVAMPAGGLFNVAYWPNGHVYDVAFAGGSRVTYGQNAREWTDAITSRTGDGTARIASALGYDVAGNLYAVSDSVDATYNRSFGYDALNRLTGIQGPWGAGSVGYAGNGNITSYALGADVRNYSYDTQNRLISVASSTESVSYTYDAEGNASPTAAPYTFDGANNLVQTASGRSNAYDGANMRVRTTHAGVTTYEFRNQQGVLLAEWRKQAGYDDTLKEHVHVGRRVFAEQQTHFQGQNLQSVSWMFLQPDPTGSPLSATTASGGLLFKETYQPYGTRIVAAADGYTSTAFSGHKQDQGDLVYMGRRYYNPKSGRFLSMDPVDFDENNPQSANRYAYANNNPNKYIDPDGRAAALIFQGARALAALYRAATAVARAGAAAGGAKVLSEATSSDSGQATGNEAGVTPRPGHPPQSGGRSGEKVKHAKGPPNSAIPSTGDSVWITDGDGNVVADVTPERVKPVTPGVGFGEKRPPTPAEVELWEEVKGSGEKK
ncbi:MAG: RHS repeat-associated core domain-containing protein [Rubrivivax sp.]